MTYFIPKSSTSNPTARTLVATGPITLDNNSATYQRIDPNGEERTLAISGDQYKVVSNTSDPDSPTSRSITIGSTVIGPGETYAFVFNTLIAGFEHVPYDVDPTTSAAYEPTILEQTLNGNASFDNSTAADWLKLDPNGVTRTITLSGTRSRVIFNAEDPLVIPAHNLVVNGTVVEPGEAVRFIHNGSGYVPVPYDDEITSDKPGEAYYPEIRNNDTRTVAPTSGEAALGENNTARIVLNDGTVEYWKVDSGVWVLKQTVEPTSISITSGALLSAQATRIVPMNSQNLIFGGLADLSNVGTTDSTFLNQANQHLFANPGSAIPAAITLLDGDSVGGVTIGAPASVTPYNVVMPDAAPTANAQALLFNPDGSSSFVSLASDGQYRGSLTLGAAPNLPTSSDGSAGVSGPLVVGDRWRIAADATLDDGSGGTIALTAGDLLYVNNASASAAAHFDQIPSGGATTDTNIFTGNLVNSFGNVSHNGGGFDLLLTNMGEVSFAGTGFGGATGDGSAWQVASDRSVTFAGYADGAQDGPGTRAVLMTDEGRMVTGDKPKSLYSKQQVRITSPTAAGETIAIDGSSSNCQVEGTPVGTVSLAAYENAIAMAADDKLIFLVDGDVAEKDSSITHAAISVTKLSDTTVSFNRPFKTGTILTFELTE